MLSDKDFDPTISRPLGDGLPRSLKNCSLAVGPEPKFLQFLAQSNLVRSGKVASSFQYHRPTFSEAQIDVVPMGNSLGKDFCTVRHNINLTGEPSIVELPDGSKGRLYPIIDRGSMQQCSPASNRQTMPSIPTHPMSGVLVCRD